MRLGNMYGPDATFLGVPGADPDDPVQWQHAARSSSALPSTAAPRTDPVADSDPRPSA